MRTLATVAADLADPGNPIGAGASGCATSRICRRDGYAVKRGCASSDSRAAPAE